MCITIVNLDHKAHIKYENEFGTATAVFLIT